MKINNPALKGGVCTRLRMKMENMPLTEEDKIRLRNCINGKADIHKILQETIKRHTRIGV